MADLDPAARKRCRTCAKPLPPQRGPGRPRLNCEDCVASEARVRSIRPAVAALSALPSVMDGTTRALSDAGLLGSPSALVVLQLAQSIDEGGHSGSALAALSREFRASLAEVLESVRSKSADDGVTWDVG